MALDARREADELDALLRGMAEQARAARCDQWASALDGAEQAIGPLGDVLHAAQALRHRLEAEPGKVEEREEIAIPDVEEEV